jgi:hypothetical protein
MRRGELPVLFVLDEAEEAYDVIWFCSDKCRALYEVTDAEFSSDTLVEGESFGACSGNVCVQCGSLLGGLDA